MKPKKKYKTLVQKSLLWEILACLSKEERNDFVMFAQLSLLKLKPKALEMLDILIEMANRNDDEAVIVTKSSFAEQLNLTMKNVNYLMSDLQQAVKRFLVFRERNTRRNEAEMIESLLSAINKRRLKEAEERGEDIIWF